METNGKTMTGEDSLRIITEMINTTKVNFSQSSFHFRFWGWLILVCSLADYLLSNFTGINNSWYVWLLTIPGAIISMVYGYVKGSRSKIYTYGDMLNMWTWMGFFFAAIILFILMRDNMGSAGPFILLLAAFPTFLTGKIIRFKPLVAGGVSMWILALVAGLTGPSVSPLAVPVAMITGYLIPGYLIKRKETHDAV
ncbi:MAG: hypothetical protein U0X39_03085 [Bacteroidales bacterium]